MSVTTSERINQDQLNALIPSQGTYEWHGALLEDAAAKTLTPIGFGDPELQAAVDQAAAAFIDRQANLDALIAKATGAVQANIDYLNVPTPTAAQVAAQVKALTRQMNALIRIVAADLDSTGGT